jgi:hypothetical protein
MDLDFSHNETIVEIGIMELGSTTYSSLWFPPNLIIINLFRKNHFRFEILIVKYKFYIFEIMKYELK